MKKIFLTAALFLLFAVDIFSQTAQPTVSPTPPDEDIVKISTTLIQIDMTVTDKNGKIISDLKPEEVEIYENGKRQEISNFSFVSNVKTTEEAPPTNRTATPAITPPSRVRPEQVRRTIALVVDDLTLSFESTHFVRRALKKFVDEQMQDGDLVAIIRTGAGIGALQQFTNDRRQLYAAIEKVRWNPMGTGRIGAFAPLEATPLEQLKSAGGTVSQEQLEAERNSTQSRDDFRSSLFATGTLGAVNYIVRGMADLPGRKSIMLLSDGFKLFTKTENGFTESSRVLDSLRRLVDQANRASVVVYTMDARGLQTLGLSAADDTAGKSADQVEQSLGDRRSELFDTQDGLRYLARQTGGIAIVNNNDLSGGIRRMLDDQSYYLIGYAPDDETFNPQTRRFNKLDVKIKRPGARVRYRSGFFGISDEQITKPSVNLTAAQRINNALTSPFAVNDISVRLNALFGNDARQGSFIRSFLHVQAQDLQFTDEANGAKKVVFDVLAVGFGDNGVPIDQISRTYTWSVKPEGYREIMKNGFVYDFTFPIKKPGAYQLRVALRDHASDKIGSANQFVEVPNLKKERLTLSSIVLENIEFKEWQRRQQGGAATTENASNPVMDTALRQFRRGTVLIYGVEVFNAKTGAAGLSSQIRIFRDGKVLYEGKPQPITGASGTDAKKIAVSGAVNLGGQMTAGEYVLQLVVTDNAAKEKYKSTAQFMQFEIVE